MPVLLIAALIGAVAFLGGPKQPAAAASANESVAVAPSTTTTTAVDGSDSLDPEGSVKHYLLPADFLHDDNWTYYGVSDTRGALSTVTYCYPTDDRLIESASSTQQFAYKVNTKNNTAEGLFSYVAAINRSASDNDYAMDQIAADAYKPCVAELATSLLYDGEKVDLSTTKTTHNVPVKSVSWKTSGVGYISGYRQSFDLELVYLSYGSVRLQLGFVDFHVVEGAAFPNREAMIREAANVLVTGNDTVTAA